MEDLKHCKKCNTTKPLTEEYWHKRKSHHTGWEFYCKECVHKTTTAGYHKNKTKWNETTKRNRDKVAKLIYEYKSSIGCAKCNESRYYVLDFHHIDPNQKLFQIGGGENGGWEKNKKEIDKCIILCSNCHREYHHFQRETRISVKDYVSLP